MTEVTEIDETTALEIFLGELLGFITRRFISQKPVVSVALIKLEIELLIPLAVLELFKMWKPQNSHVRAMTRLRRSRTTLEVVNRGINNKYSRGAYSR